MPIRWNMTINNNISPKVLALVAFIRELGIDVYFVATGNGNRRRRREPANHIDWDERATLPLTISQPKQFTRLRNGHPILQRQSMDLEYIRRGRNRAAAHLELPIAFPTRLNCPAARNSHCR